MRLLVISSWFPCPPINGAKTRTLSLLRVLARWAEVDLVTEVNTLTSEQVAEGSARLRAFCRSVQSVPAVRYNSRANPLWRRLVDPVPDVVRVTRNPELERLVLSTWAPGVYDAVIVSESGFPASCTPAAQRLGLGPLVADSVELGVFRPQPEALPARRCRQWLTWQKARRFAGAVVSNAAAYTVASEQERQLFGPVAKRHVRCVVIPHAIDLSDYDADYGPRDRNTIIHCGAFSYPVNYDAVRWFAERVYPQLPDAADLRLLATGNTAGADLGPIRRGCPVVTFTGFVTDVKSLIARSRMSIVPLQAGGGTRLKIPESMALGTPVVSTSRGAEGLGLIHDEHILLADTPEEFALQVDRLRRDDALWERLSRQGREHVSRRFTTTAVDGQYRELVEGVARHPSATEAGAA